jgi:hypothetical protein
LIKQFFCIFIEIISFKKSFVVGILRFQKQFNVNILGFLIQIDEDISAFFWFYDYFGYFSKNWANFFQSVGHPACHPREPRQVRMA